LIEIAFNLLILREESDQAKQCRGIIIPSVFAMVARHFMPRQLVFAWLTRDPESHHLQPHRPISGVKGECGVKLKCRSCNILL
jgi:hypothetical protein